MLESKMLNLLRKLGPKQLKKLGDFVASPYFNKKGEAILLYNYLMKYKPTFDHSALTKEKAFSFIFKDQKYNEKEIGYLMSNMVKLTETFLMHEKAAEMPVESYMHLLELYQDWDMEPSFFQWLKTARKTLAKYPFKNANYYYFEYLLSNIENTYFDKKKKHVHDQSLQNAINHLEEFYLAMKLKYCCEMLNRRVVMESTYEIRFLDEILAHLDNNPISENAYISIYGNILRAMLYKDDFKYFQLLKEQLAEHADELPKDELRTMYLFAINYCVKNTNSGNDQFLREIFELYKHMIESKLIFEKDYVSPWSYMNIVVASVRIGEYEWTEKFIKQHKKHIDPKFKLNAYTYSLAYLYFHQKDFNKALELLNKVEFDDIFYIVASKALLLRIYYELDELGPLWSLSESFRLYLRRNKLVAEGKREVYVNLARFVNRLSRIEKGNHKALNKLKERILSSKTVQAPWLLEKIAEKL